MNHKKKICGVLFVLEVKRGYNTNLKTIFESLDHVK